MVINTYLEVDKMTNLTQRAGEILRTFEKNGKPYKEVIEICSRCGGTGNYSYNQKDGTLCYGCNGQGVQKIERRIYTDKELVSQEKAKTKKVAKKETERLEKIANAEIEKQNRVNEYIQNNPITYIVVDKDSYNKKEIIKANKYKWMTWHWVGHKEIEGIETMAIDTKDVINEYGYIIDTAINDKVKGYK